MKIICTKEEYTRMVARCATNLALPENDEGGCNHCLLLEPCDRMVTNDGCIALGESYLFLNDITEIRE